MQNNFQNMFHFYDSLLRFMGKGPILMFVIMVPTLKKSTKPKDTRRVLKLERLSDKFLPANQASQELSHHPV